MKPSILYFNLLAGAALLVPVAPAQVPQLGEPASNQISTHASHTVTQGSVTDEAVSTESSSAKTAPADSTRPSHQAIAPRIRDLTTQHAEALDSVQADGRADFVADAPGTLETPLASAQGKPAASIASSLTERITAAQIRDATPESRGRVLSDVGSSIEASQRALARLRQQRRDLGREARDQFNETTREVRAREKDLHDNLKAARRATTEQSTAAQARLAASFESYAQAVAESEGLMNASHSTHVTAAE
jgi:hypothetical protein